MSKRNKNYTFSMPIETLDRLKDYAAEGRIASVNSAVKEAVEAYVAEIDKAALHQQMQEAASDKAFMDDINSAMADFINVDYEEMQEKN